MSAVQAAVERGRDAAASARRDRGRYEPVGVDNPGWLTARIRDKQTGNVEGVFYAQGCWQFSGVTYDKDGKPKSHDVRSATLKRIAKAMVWTGPGPEWRDELVTEVSAARRAAVDERSREPTRTRRGKA